jgi:hypothetical protein
VVCIHKNGSRCTAASNFFQDFAVGHLRKPMPAIFLRRGHAEHANSAESINYAARYIRCSVDFRRIEMLVQKLAKLGKSSVQFDLLLCRDARIRHYPIGNEMASEKTFGKTERLRTRKKQFFGLLDFLLSLGVELIHSGCF